MLTNYQFLTFDRKLAKHPDNISVELVGRIDTENLIADPIPLGSICEMPGGFLPRYYASCTFTQVPGPLHGTRDSALDALMQAEAAKSWR